MNDTLMLSFGGPYTVAEPTLMGWARIMEALRPGEYGEVFAAIRTVQALASERNLQSQEAVVDAIHEDGLAFAQSICEALMPVLSKMPRLAVVAVEACLRDQGGDVVPEGTAMRATASDLIESIVITVQAGVWTKLVGTVKNRLGPVLPMVKVKAETPSDRAGSDGSTG